MLVERWLPIWEIAFGTVAVVASLLIHGAGMLLVQGRSLRYAHLPLLHWQREARFIVLVLMLLTTHFVELIVWAAFLTAIGAIAIYRDAFYFAAVTYTTLGYGENALPRDWRILAPMLAISGVFAFGWTTSVLFSIVSRKDAAPGDRESADGGVRRD